MIFCTQLDLLETFNVIFLCPPYDSMEHIPSILSSHFTLSMQLLKVVGVIVIIFGRMIGHDVLLIILSRHIDSTIFVEVMGL
jgi:hypothetical protein